MKNKLDKLHNLHDNLKGSPIRLVGLSDVKIPHNAKDLYYRKLSVFLDQVISYVEEFKDEEHVIKTLEFCEKSEYDLSKMNSDLNSCYYKYDELLAFIAETDFKIYSPLHYTIEHLYYYLNNEYKSEEFKVRMK